MLIPDSISNSFHLLTDEQVGKIVKAILVHISGGQVDMESFDLVCKVVVSNAIGSIEEDKDRASHKRGPKFGSRNNPNGRRGKTNCNGISSELVNELVPISSESADTQSLKPTTNSQKISSELVLKEREKDKEETLSSYELLFVEEKEKDKENEKKTVEKKPKSRADEELFLSKAEPRELIPALKEWLAFKREKGQTYKPIGLKTCLKRLENLSGGDPSKARMIVEQSIANNYSGLFELRNNNQQQKQPTYIPYDDNNTRENVKKFYNPYANEQ